MTEPQRIQRKRAKGWRMPENTVYVGRPSKFGNPFAARVKTGRGEVGLATGARETLVREFRTWLTQPLTTQLTSDMKWVQVYPGGRFPNNATHGGIPWDDRDKVLDSLDELRGKNLACWCPLSQPCHADVLLELANKEALV